MSKNLDELTKIDNYYKQLKNNIGRDKIIDADNFKLIVNNNNCNENINKEIFYLLFDKITDGIYENNSQNRWIIDYFLSLPNFQFNIGNNPKEFDKYFNVYKESVIYTNAWRSRNKFSENIIKSGKVNIDNYIKYLLSKLNNGLPADNYFQKIKFIYQKCSDKDKKIIENIFMKNNISCTFINNHNKIRSISKLFLDLLITLIFIISPHYLSNFIIFLLSNKFPFININLFSNIKNIIICLIYLANIIILYLYFYYSNGYYSNIRLLRWSKVLYRIRTLLSSEKI